MLRALSLTALAALVAAWLPGLFWGFWVDETVTWWIVRQGLTHVLAEITPGQAPLYYLLAAPFSFPGNELQECLLRLPSLLCSIATLYVVWRWAEEANGPGSGRLAAVLLAALPSFTFHAVQARPYAALAWISVTSSWILWRWMHRGGRWQWTGYAILLAAAVYTHFFAVLLGLCHLILALAAGLTRERWIRLAGAWLASGLFLIPVLRFTGNLLAAGNSFNFTLPPSKSYLAQMGLQTYVGPLVVLILILGALYWQRGSIFLKDRTALALLAAWILPVLILFAAARWQGKSVFFDHYLVFALPFLAISLARWAARLPATGQGLVLAAALLTGLQPQRFLASEGLADLRSGMELVRDLSLYEASPLGAPSWLIESKSWDLYGPWGGYMFAYLEIYPVPNPVERLQFQMVGTNRPLLARLLAGKWAREKRILLGPMAGDPQWLYADLARAGYTVRKHSTPSMFVLECTRP